MKTNKKKIQLILISIALLLIAITYFYIPKINEKKFKDEVVKKNKVTETKTESGNLFEDVSYRGLYQSDNPFLIQADQANILEGDSDIVHMENVLVTITLQSGEIITITSDKAKYDKVKYDIFFEGNVKAADSESTLYSDNLDLLSNESATVYNKVILVNKKKSYLKADSVKYDFKTKYFKMSMFEDSKKVRAKLIE